MFVKESDVESGDGGLEPDAAAAAVSGSDMFSSAVAIVLSAFTLLLLPTSPQVPYPHLFTFSTPQSTLCSLVVV